MNVEDRTAPVDDDALQDAIQRMVGLVDGLQSGAHHCPCGRYYRVGITDELRQVLTTIKKAIRERTGDEITADHSRFALLEVD